MKRPWWHNIARFIGFLGMLFALQGLLWWGYFELFTAWWPTVRELWRGIGAVWATMFTTVLIATAWGRIMGRKMKDPFGAFNDAFRRIAQGDYAVQIDPQEIHGDRDENPFRDLAGNLNAMAQSLAQVEELRRQFVADVSHEFQSPLTSILGFTQALADPQLPAATRTRYLGIVEAEARRLSRLSDNLLKLNTLEDRSGPPDPETFRLDAQLREVVVALEPQWAAKDLAVEAELVNLEVVGNRELWSQVWMNLLTNAIKFTPRGGAITVRLTGDPVRVDIVDTGIGLAEADRQRVFERFFKADAARTLTDAATGSGLGLALVHRIVTLHGGRVEALSDGPGRGTTLRVQFSLPETTIPG